MVDVRERAARGSAAPRLARDDQFHRRPAERRRGNVPLDAVQHGRRRDQRTVLRGRCADAGRSCGADARAGARCVYAGDAWRAEESWKDAGRVGG